MPCITNAAHAQHTLLRGCCQSTCPCPGGASFSAEPYCPCHDTVGKNITRNYSQQVCHILGTLSATIASTESALVLLDWSSIRCGTFLIYTLVGTGQPVETLIGTVVGASSGGTINFTGATDVDDNGEYQIYVGSGSATTCATVTIPAGP